MAVFKIAEIMDMGIEKEKKRRDFYGKVKDIYKSNQKLTKLFADLEKWECEHVDRFQKIKDQLGKEQESPQSYPGELDNYIQAYLDNRLYYEIDSKKFADKVKNIEDALSIAMGFEKDAIIFFTELYDLVRDAHKEVVKQLIQEEKQHLVYLFKMKKEIVK